MNRLLCFVSALLLTVAAVAGDKVVESSSRRAPHWIGGVEEESIIVCAEGASLELAKDKAFTRVREQIIYAVATRVQSSTTITLNEVTDNGAIQSHREVNSALSVTAADIPYLADVSPTHADDYYWVKSRRKDKSEYYTYHLKYPLSNSKLRLLVDEYEKRQKQLNDSLQTFASADMSQFDDLSQMLQLHAQLNQFKASLAETDSRRDICATIARNYERQLSQNLHATVLSSNREFTRVALCYGDKQLANAPLPRTRTNCLVGITTEVEPNSVLFSYDYNMGCYEDEPNWIEIIYTVLGRKFPVKCYIK
jgi:hypothetical protein